MRSKLVLLGCTLLLASLCWQCQPETPEDTPILYADFFVRYLAADQELKAQAYFAETDSVQIRETLQFPGGLAFLGSGMEARPLRYTTTRTLDFVSPLRFSFRPEKEAEVIDLAIEFTPVTNFEITQASLADGIRLQLNAPLAADELLVLFFTDSTQQARTIERLGPSESRQIFVPAPAFVDYPAGPYQLYLVKHKEQTRTENGFRTHWVIEYYTEQQEVNLE